MRPTVGALFAGYGGIELALASVLGPIDLRWYAEFDKHAASIMARHHPDVTNLWDVTKVTWADVEPVDILTGGSPCQDLSHAGKRKGMTDGTRSNLWAEMREAVAVLRPRLVVWENVRGAYSACADSELGRCPRCVDETHPGGHAPVLRALGRVLGDLSELGYDARWYGLRAADVGAPHGRFRIFLFATPADADDAGWLEQCRPLAARAEQSPAQRCGADSRLSLLPTPRASEPDVCSADFNPSLNQVVTQRPPIPANPERGRTSYGTPPWGDYAPAIARWEPIVGRPAPAPTEPGPKGNPRLSAAFVEWMMGLPAGHVTHVDIPRNAQLKALGNGVVPQQCAAALRVYLADEYGVPSVTPEPAAELELLPTPCAHESGNTAEDHLRKKPGRSKVTDLSVMARAGLLGGTA